MALIQKRSLILLTLLVTLFHVLLLSIHFDSYREWFYKKYAQISKPIRINWAPNLQSPTSVAQNSEVLSKLMLSAFMP